MALFADRHANRKLPQLRLRLRLVEHRDWASPSGSCFTGSAILVMSSQGHGPKMAADNNKWRTSHVEGCMSRVACRGTHVEGRTSRVLCRGSHVEVEGGVKQVIAGHRGIGMETRSATVMIRQNMDMALNSRQIPSTCHGCLILHLSPIHLSIIVGVPFLSDHALVSPTHVNPLTLPPPTNCRPSYPHSPFVSIASSARSHPKIVCTAPRPTPCSRSTWTPRKR